MVKAVVHAVCSWSEPRIEKPETEDVGYGNGVVLLFQNALHELRALFVYAELQEA